MFFLKFSCENTSHGFQVRTLQNFKENFFVCFSFQQSHILFFRLLVALAEFDDDYIFFL